MLKFLLFLSTLTLAYPLAPRIGAQGSPLVTAFVQALNSGDEAQISQFVGKWCSQSLPPADRVARLKSISSQGAPFQILSVDKTSSGLLAILKDRNGEQIGLQIVLDAQGKYDRATAGPPDALNAPPPKDYTGWKDLRSLAELIRKDTGNPAMGIAVIRNGRLEQAVSGTRTVAGAEAVGPDEPWSIGSIGKPLCSTIIGKLIEMGKLRWDTTLGEALSGVPMKPEYRGVTLEQIMHHRGGIVEMLGMRAPEVRRIVGSETDPTKIRLNMARDLLSRDPVAKPGTRFVYSNGGYMLLGVIAERVMGKPYERLLHDMIFQPLGLRHSYANGDPLPAARPHGHVPGPGGLQRQDFSGPMEIIFAPAGGGIFMSVGDLARFGQAHLVGLKGKDGLLKASTIARLHRGIPEEDGGQSYACGWGIRKIADGQIMHTHNGSNGTMRAQLSIFPSLNLVVASMVNAGGESEPSPPLQAVLAIEKRN